ncbi:MAG: DNA cytosine methyltransferase [Candidatus Bathyarchaeia archaeon]
MLTWERARALLRSRFKMREPVTGGVCRTLVASQPHVVVERKEGGWFRLRRLSPVECERLQGFPDGWTECGLTKEGELVRLNDRRRYILLGNAVTVPVAEFLGKRLLEVFRSSL